MKTEFISTLERIRESLNLAIKFNCLIARISASENCSDVMFSGAKLLGIGETGHYFIASPEWTIEFPNLLSFQSSRGATLYSLSPFGGPYIELMYFIYNEEKNGHPGFIRINKKYTMDNAIIIKTTERAFDSYKLMRKAIINKKSNNTT